MLTKTEATRRLRNAADAARAADWNLTKNMRVEVGTRTIPVYADTEAQARKRTAHVQSGNCLLDPDGIEGKGWDDLLDNLGMAEAARRDDQVRGEGYVAHIYFSTTGAWGELYSVVTVWTGTDTQPPVVL